MLCQPSLEYLFPRSPAAGGQLSSPSLVFPNMGGFTACSYPSLTTWQLLSDLDRSGQFLQAETMKLCSDRLGAFHILPLERSCGSLFVAIARATASWCFESPSRGHCCAVVHATRLLLQDNNTALASLATLSPFPVYKMGRAVWDVCLLSVKGR